MKVLLISKALVSGPYQKKLEELASESDIELRALVPPFWREGKIKTELSRVHIEGYDLRVCAPVFNGRFHLHFFPRLAHEMSDFRPDVLHIDEEPYNLATAHATWLARRMNIRAVFFAWQNLNRQYYPPFSWFEQFTYRNAVAIAGTTRALDVLREKGFSGAATVIPQFGVDPDTYRPAVSGASHRTFTVGFVGRLVEGKGIRTLLPAFERFSGPEHLALAGDGPLAGWICEYATNRDFKNRVCLAGQLRPDEIPDFLRSIDVLVLPSVPTDRWVEQFGRSLIEAMACEIPVIGSNIGEIPKVIGDAGILVPPGNVDALAKALTDLRDDMQWRLALGKKGRRRVIAQFTQSKIAAATAEFYRTLFSESGQCR